MRETKIVTFEASLGNPAITSVSDEAGVLKPGFLTRTIGQAIYCSGCFRSLIPPSQAAAFYSRLPSSALQHQTSIKSFSPSPPLSPSRTTLDFPDHKNSTNYTVRLDDYMRVFIFTFRSLYETTIFLNCTIQVISLMVNDTRTWSRRCESGVPDSDKMDEDGMESEESVEIEEEEEEDN